MKKIYFFLTAGMLSCTLAHAQTKFGDNKTVINGSSLVELESSNKGLLLPRLNLTNTTTWGLATATPVNGMLVYNTAATIASTNPLYPVITGGKGVYYWDGAGWIGINTAATSFWSLNGNTGTTPPTAVGSPAGSTNFLGTTDAKNLAITTNGTTRAVFDQNGSLFGGGTTPNAAIATLSANSLVWGASNIDSGYQSIVTGAGNTVGNNVNGSAVSGIGNTVSGNISGAVIGGGANTVTATMPYSAVFGFNNLPADSALLAIGNGTTGVQSNAVTVVKTAALPAATSNSSTLNVNGSVAANIVSVRTSYTLLANDYTVVCRGPGGITLTLPDPATCKGRIYHLVNNSDADVALSLSIETAYGETVSSISSGYLSAGYGNSGNKWTIQSDGTTWVALQNI